MPTQRCEEKSAPARVVGGRRERESPSPLAPLFICFPPPALPCVNWVSQECCLFYQRSSLRSSGLPLFYFRGLFSSLSFSHRHFELLFPGGSDGKAFACNAGDLGSIPGLGRSPGEGNGSPLQYSCLENAWTEEPGRLLCPWGCNESDITERLHFPYSNYLTVFIEKVNGCVFLGI